MYLINGNAQFKNVLKDLLLYQEVYINWKGFIHFLLYNSMKEMVHEQRTRKLK